MNYRIRILNKEKIKEKILQNKANNQKVYMQILRIILINSK
jgi:hypothetical protein